jgi:HK97 family phage portal protein
MRLFTRGLRPPTDSGTIPNGNDPADVPPASVGPDVARPGDPNGFELEVGGPGGIIPRSVIRPSRWDGWPAEWATPLWGHVEDLSDTAWSALDLNSSVFASMPPYLVGASPSLPSDWISNPQPEVYNCWQDFARELMWDFQTGEAIVYATARYSNGFPARFLCLAPWKVDIDFDANHRRRYKVGSMVLDPADVLHLRYRSSPTVARGIGPLDVGRTRMVAAGVLSRYATNYALSGGVPPSILKHPDELGSEQVNDLLDQWVQSRMSNLGLPAVLSGGVEWEATGTDPLSTALVELESFQESRIAVLLGVPPFLLGLPSGGDSMTYSNVTSLFDYHWRAGLKPKADRLMSSLAGWLTPRGTGLEVNRDEYVRPGPLERAQTWQILISIGVLTVEEVRQIERFSLTGSTTAAPLTAGVLA